MSPLTDSPVIDLAPTWRHSHSRFLDDHAGGLQWKLGYDQIDCGSFIGEITELHLPGVQLFRETTSRALRQCGGIKPGAIGIAMMRRGQGSLVYMGRAVADRIVFCGPNQEIDLYTPPACTFIGMQVESALSLEQAADLSIPKDRWKDCTLEAGKASQDALVDFVGTTLDLVAARPRLLREPATVARLRDSALLHCISSLSRAQDSGLRVAARARKRIVDQACDLMLSRPHDPPSLLAICQQIGVSATKLGYCFQEVLGSSPQACLRVLRLNAARRDLSGQADAAGSVYDVATRWGFWHFGRFSAQYKRQFGESPSSTLKRGKLRPRFERERRAVATV